MKIIELLNKIANDENYRPKFRYKYQTYCLTNEGYYHSPVNNSVVLFQNFCLENILNDEVEIIEEIINPFGEYEDTSKEEKKIPEKLGLTYLKDDDRNNIIDKINEVIDYLDYLKSKGE